MLSVFREFKCKYLSYNLEKKMTYYMATSYLCKTGGNWIEILVFDNLKHKTTSFYKTDFKLQWFFHYPDHTFHHSNHYQSNYFMSISSAYKMTLCVPDLCCSNFDIRPSCFPDYTVCEMSFEWNDIQKYVIYKT